METAAEKLRSGKRGTPELLRGGARPAALSPSAAVYPRRSVRLFVVVAGRLGWFSGSQWSLGEEAAEMCRPGWEVGGAASGERKLYS